VTEDTENELTKALIEHLRGDAALKALLGDPARIWDQPPEAPVYPHLTLGRMESRPYAGADEATEHVLTLTCTSRFGGAEEAKAVAAAARARLHGAEPAMDAGRVANLTVTYADVFRGADWRSVYGVLRLRVVTEA
jgi:hypothetical protein